MGFMEEYINSVNVNKKKLKWPC